MFFSQEQRKTLRKIKKGRIKSLSDFYLIELKGFSAGEVKLSGGKTLLHNEIVVPIRGLVIPNIDDRSKALRIRIEEFTDLFEYLEKERFIYSREIEPEKIIWLCNEDRKVWNEIKPLISRIYNKEIIKSSRIHRFKGRTVEEKLRRFSKWAAVFAIIATLLATFLGYWLNNRKPFIRDREEIEKQDPAAIQIPRQEQPTQIKTSVESSADSVASQLHSNPTD